MKLKPKTNQQLRITVVIINISLFFLTFISCKKELDAEFQKGPATVIVKLSNKTTPQNSRSVTNNPDDLSDRMLVKSSTVKISNDLSIISNVYLEQSNVVSNNARNITNKTEIAHIVKGTKYRIAIFHENGNLITDKEFIRKQETDGDSFQLDGGVKYTFIAYSLNSTTASTPPVTYTNNVTNLANAKLDVNGNEDFMFSIVEQRVNGNTTNYVNTTLKHQAQQITTTLDASQTGLNILSIKASFQFANQNNSHRPRALISLVNGNIERTGNPTNVPLIFSSLNSTSIVSNPSYINAPMNNNSKLVLESINFEGDINHNNITLFDDLEIKPGQKYSIEATLKNSDGPIDHNGIPSVRIGNQIWMAHNVGVNSSVNVNQRPITASLHGDFFDFKFSNPNVKHLNDPCPNGFKTPSEEDYNILNSNTNTSSAGQNSTLHDNGFLLTSKKNKNASLLFPSQGYMFISNAFQNQGGILTHPSGGSNNSSTNTQTLMQLTSLGQTSSYLTSSNNNPTNSFSRATNTTNQILNELSSGSGLGNLTGMRFPIRCIAE